MRSLFISLADKIQNGSFIFVAKSGILDIDFMKLKNDTLYALKKLDAIK